MGSRRTHEGVENVYAAATIWVDRALRADDSLFTPGKAIWTRELLGELRDCYLDNPDTSSGNFYEKLQRSTGKQIPGGVPVDGGSCSTLTTSLSGGRA